MIADDEMGEAPGSTVRRLSELPGDPAPMLATGLAPWDYVVGGGFVQPSSILLLGGRGIGKSTYALSLACELARVAGRPALYGSAEMPAQHMRAYAARLGLSPAATDRIWIQESHEAADLLADIERTRPVAVVWDSIQRYQWHGAIGELELREVVRRAIAIGQRLGVVSLLLSQVTKDGAFLGPSGIAHDCDVVLRLAKMLDGALVIFCDDKNRFAPTPRSAVVRPAPETSA